MGFYKIGLSFITLWHKPAIKEIKRLKEIHGINMIVTLLNDKESPQTIIKECESHGIINFRIPL